MKSERDVREKLEEIEKTVLTRLKNGHSQIRLFDSGRIEILSWVLGTPNIPDDKNEKDEELG